MLLDCPACGKAAIAGGACPRCGCDLSRLQAVLECAARELREAADYIRSGDWRGALHGAERSWQLRHSLEAAAVAFLAAAAAGETARAARWHDAAIRANPRPE